MPSSGLDTLATCVRREDADAVRQLAEALGMTPSRLLRYSVERIAAQVRDGAMPRDATPGAQ